MEIRLEAPKRENNVLFGLDAAGSRNSDAKHASLMGWSTIAPMLVLAKEIQPKRGVFCIKAVDKDHVSIWKCLSQVGCTR
jgi:hypothetical protein